MIDVKFTETILIKQSAEIVFDFTQDYSKRLTWDSFLKKAELINGATRADKGVKAFCVARNGFGMETEYITFQRPKVTAIKMTNGPFIFKSFLGSWTFKKVTENVTQVTFLYSFSLRFPFHLISKYIRAGLQSNVRQRLTDLKMSIENQCTDTYVVNEMSPNKKPGC